MIIKIAKTSKLCYKKNWVSHKITKSSHIKTCKVYSPLLMSTNILNSYIPNFNTDAIFCIHINIKSSCSCNIVLLSLAFIIADLEKARSYEKIVTDILISHLLILYDHQFILQIL